jgi:hypothetical protein
MPVAFTTNTRGEMQLDEWYADGFSIPLSVRMNKEARHSFCTFQVA